MIGNSVSPVMAEALFSAIRDRLELTIALPVENDQIKKLPRGKANRITPIQLAAE
jgi:hypothetical protein